jgi:hypothetical protein
MADDTTNTPPTSVELDDSPLSIFKSRKFVYGSLSMGFAGFIYFLNLYLITKYPAVAPSYLSLFNTIISFIAGITSGLLGLHQFMDYTTSATNAISNSSAITNAVSDATTTAVNITKTYNYTEPEKAQNVAASRANNI